MQISYIKMHWWGRFLTSDIFQTGLPSDARGVPQSKSAANLQHQQEEKKDKN